MMFRVSGCRVVLKTCFSLYAGMLSLTALDPNDALGTPVVVASDECEFDDSDGTVTQTHCFFYWDCVKDYGDIAIGSGITSESVADTAECNTCDFCNSESSNITPTDCGLTEESYCYKTKITLEETIDGPFGLPSVELALGIESEVDKCFKTACKPSGPFPHCERVEYQVLLSVKKDIPITAKAIYNYRWWIGGGTLLNQCTLPNQFEKHYVYDHESQIKIANASWGVSAVCSPKNLGCGP